MSAQMIQGSEEWLAARLGKVTASRMDDLLARTKSGYGAGRSNYMAQLIAERMTGKVAESYTNAAMAWGTENEPAARAAYEFVTDQEVTETGFILHPGINDSGASPDGLVGDKGLVEIKCPNTATHIETLLTHTIPGKYQKQMLWQMACTGRVWCDFVSFDPRMPEHLRIFVQRMAVDSKEVQRMELEVVEFLTEMVDKISKLGEIGKT